MSIRALSNELQKKAEEELNEKPDRIQEDLKHIREWIEKQPHLTVRSDEQSLIGFLRGCKYSLQETKAKIDNFYTVRTMLPEYFDNRDPFSPEIQEILKANTFIPLPNTVDKTGPPILLYACKRSNPETMSLANLTKVYFMLMDILMTEDDNCLVSGIMLCSDFKDMPLSYIMEMTPTILQKFILCVQGTYPIRLKGFHFINASPVFGKVFDIIKNFLTKKIRDRVVMYSETNTADVFKVIPQSILPKEYGGNSDSLDELGAMWKKKVESYREWFLEDSKYRSNEKLRPGKPKTSVDIFGVEGSFRKLNID